VFTFYAPAQAIMYGVWLVPGVLAALIIRRIGASLYAEFLAALISVQLGSAWGWVAVIQGAAQGAASEIGFAASGYRSWRTPFALLSALLAGLTATLFDAFHYYPETSWLTYRIPYILMGTASSVAVAGVGSVLLVRALAPTGVLDSFPSGRERTAV